MKKTLIALAGLLLLLCAAARAQEQPADITGKVNLIMDDGTIIMYAGAKQGVKAGDEFAAYRQNQQVGAVKIVRVTDVAAYGKAITGDIKEMDTLVRTKAASVPVPPPAKTEQPVKSSPVKSPPAKTETPKTEAPKTETPKAAPSEKDQKKAQAEKKPKPEAKPEAKKEEKPKTDERKPASTPPPEVPLPKEKGPAVAAAYYGTAGLLYMPIAEVFQQGKGAVGLHTLKANDKSLQYKDMGFGVTYGVSQDIEAAYERVSTKSTVAGSGGTKNTSVISIKYLAMKSKDEKPGTGYKQIQQGNLNYAVGMSYYSMGGVTIPGAGSTAAKVTRIYVVGSGEYSSVKVHVGVYDQTGSLLRLNGNYKGIGFMLGAEYPLGGMLGAPGGLSVIGEYDSKAYYLDTMRTPSVGLRYKAASFSLTLGILDVTQTKIFSLGGEYNF